MKSKMISQRKLDSILAKHKLWIKSEHKKGKRANLSGQDLGVQNLNFMDLQYANLSNANLTASNLIDSNLSFADLRGANLTDALITLANLRGVLLHGPELLDICGFSKCKVSKRLLPWLSCHPNFAEWLPKMVIYEDD